MTTAVRQRMTHRALVERTVTTSADAYGDAPAPTWATHIAAMPCFFYVETGRAAGGEAVRQRGTVVAERLRMLAPKGTDVTERDRINGVTDRRGTVIYAGAINIESVTPSHDHLEIRLGSVSG